MCKKKDAKIPLHALYYNIYTPPMIIGTLRC